MADVIFVAVIVAFFAVAVLLVRACDRIIGPDPVVPSPVSEEDLAVLAGKDHEAAAQ